jgi:hypothetical protein
MVCVKRTNSSSCSAGRDSAIREMSSSHPSCIGVTACDRPQGRRPTSHPFGPDFLKHKRDVMAEADADGVTSAAGKGVIRIGIEDGG